MELEIDYSVCKANDLIQKASYDLSATEQKLLLYIISKIKPEDKAFQEYTFRMVDLLEVMGLDGDKKSRDQVKNSLRGMRNKEVHIQTETEDIYTGWINTPSFTRGYAQTVTVRVEDKLMPYLLDLSERFTLYQLRNIMAMKGKYAIRLYELAKSHAYQGGFEIDVQDFQRMLQCENYTWRGLRERVILPAIKEINLLSDLLIGYKPVRTGHAYTGLKFSVNEKGTPENLTAQTRQEMILYGW